VIMSNPEDAMATVKMPRLLAAGADTRLVHFWPGKMSLPGAVDALEELVQFHNVELVTIDPIAKHIRSSDPNTALEPLVAMAERTGVAIVGVHHLNKRMPKDATPAEFFGGASGGWLGTARFAHVLGPADGGEAESRFLGVAKSNHAPDDAKSIEFYIDSAEVDLPDGKVVETGRLIFVKSDSKVTSEAIVHFRGKGYKDASPEKKAVAVEALTMWLKDGPMPAKTVFEKAAEHGVSQATMRRAGEQIEVVKQRVGFGPGSYLTWELPDAHPLKKSIGVKDNRATPGRKRGGRKPAKPNGDVELTPGQMDVDDVIDEILGGGNGKAA